MSNEINRNYQNYNSMPKMRLDNGLDNAEKILSENIVANNEKSQSSMDCLNSMGVAQVNMTNPQIKNSIQEFLQDEEYAKAHVEFCDSLIEKGYNLENAILTTDNVFANLKKGSTYQK